MGLKKNIVTVFYIILNYLVMNTDCDVLGTITITVEALDVLKSVAREGLKSKKSKKRKP